MLLLENRLHFLRTTVGARGLAELRNISFIYDEIRVPQRSADSQDASIAQNSNG